ncbi:MAG: transcription elongation factor GreB [Bdellovibrionaceae bacterium]|nr:transcription elongation factor GreB [Pseudobdellovibrionaceae bacterium]
MAKHYITKQGADKLRAEYDHLFRVERPKIVETVAWAAGNGDRSENGDYIYGKQKLREIDRRLHFLKKRLEDVEVVDVAQIRTDKVVFGATVAVENEDGLLKTYRIVGQDEMDTAKGWISWRSPMAKALLGKQVDDEAVVHLPAGEAFFVIQSIDYLVET